jgi:hypothetical protein
MFFCNADPCQVAANLSHAQPSVSGNPGTQREPWQMFLRNGEILYVDFPGFAEIDFLFSKWEIHYLGHI